MAMRVEAERHLVEVFVSSASANGISTTRILHGGGNARKQVIAVSDRDGPADRIAEIGRVIVYDLAEYQRYVRG